MGPSVNWMVVGSDKMGEIPVIYDGQEQHKVNDGTEISLSP